MEDTKGTYPLVICGKKKRTLKLKTGLWADLKGLHIDKRTRLGKWMDHLRVGLIKHVGGEPTVAESILIEQIVIKTLKAHLYHVGLFRQKSFGSRDHALAIQNSIRCDLMALGLEKKVGKAVDLDTYIRSKQG